MNSWIAAVINVFNRVYPDTIKPNTPNCSLVAAGGACADVSKQLTGNGVSTEDLFTITGRIRILQIYGVVTAEAEDPNITFSNAKFSIYDQTNTVDQCTVVDASGIEIDDVLLKSADDGSPMVWMDTDNGGIYSESTTFRHAFSEGIAAAKNGAATVIRFSYTGDAATDVTIHFFVRWQPMCEGANLVAI